MVTRVPSVLGPSLWIVMGFVPVFAVCFEYPQTGETRTEAECWE